MELALEQIKRDHKLSPRIEEGTIPEIAQRYAECFDQLPPVVVFKTPDESKYLLVDGWHRYRAAEILGLQTIKVDAKHGSRKDAEEYALLANLRHGKPLTRREKRAVIEAFLRLHPERTNTWLAEDLSAAPNTIISIRRKLEASCKLHVFDTLLTKDNVPYPWGPEKSTKQDSESDEESGETQETTGDTEGDAGDESTDVSMLGPYELNKAHQVDCLVGLLGLPADSVDLVFTDPPYNLGKDYGSGSKDSRTPSAYLAWCLKWFMQVYRVLRPGGAFYVMQYPEIAAAWKQSLDSLLTFRHWISWVYPSNIGQGKNWRRSHRAILYYVKAGAEPWFHGDADPQPYRNPDDRRVKHLGREGTTAYDWWEYDLVKNVSKDKTSWPNQLPVALVQRIILTSCAPDGMVLDPFMGSGSTAEAAKDAERKWIGFDVEAAACELANQRGRI